jgi:hypothetical protein
MDSEIATDDVLLSIASIETHRREIETASGLPASCNEALRKLHQLLDRERGALQMHGTGTQRHSVNIGTVTREIARVKIMAGDNSPPPASRNPRPGHEVSLQDGARTFPRSKGRRTMGRSER